MTDTTENNETTEATETKAPTATVLQTVKRPEGPRPNLIRGDRILPIIPNTIEEAYRYAQNIIKAGLAPASYEYDRDAIDEKGRELTGADPQKVMIGIMKGLEVGLPPITALSTIAIINKRPCIWGDGAMALVQKADVVDRYEITELGPKPEETEKVGIEQFTNEYGFLCRIWRKNQSTPYEGRFTVADAKRAGLWAQPKRQPWMLYPKRMLRNRAVAFALRDGFADCLAGLQIREEVEDMPMPAPEKTNTSFLDDSLPPAPAIEHRPEPEIGDVSAWKIIDGIDFATEFNRLLADAVAVPSDVDALIQANADRVTMDLAEAAKKRQQELS